METATSVPPTNEPADGADAAHTRARAARVPGRAWLSRLGDVVLGTVRNRRIRTTQWLIALPVYVSSAVALGFGISAGWVDGSSLVAWCAFIVMGLSTVYAAIRSGWSERFEDPALTVMQMVLGIVAVEWAYLICGPVRGLTLLPLLLIFTFGAFSLSWRRFAWLTVFALATLVACVVFLQAARGDAWSLASTELRIDLTNVMMVMILLPAISLVAARLSALRSRLGSQREDLVVALREVQRLATHDDLTGLVNRRFMQERIAQERTRFERSGHAFSIALIDIDHFKRINDLHGHAHGDEVLRMLASELSSALRGGDLLARWGGEEFLLLLPDTQAPQAKASVERLLSLMGKLPLDTGLELSFSAGVTEHRPCESVATTVARADAAMYAAKAAGRSRISLC